MTPSGATYHPQTDPDAALRGAFVVAFTSTVAGTLSITFVDDAGESMVNPATNTPWTATVRPGAIDPDATVADGAGADAAAMGLSNALQLPAADAAGNVILEQPRDGDVEPHSGALAFEASAGSHPSDADVSGIAQTTSYVGRGVHSVFFTPPTHAAPYYLRATVVIDGVTTRATHDFLVSAAGDFNAYKSAVLDARMRDVDVSRPLVGFAAGVVGRLTLEIRDDNGAAIGAPSASFARVSMVPDGADPRLELTSHGRIAITFNATRAGEYALLVEAGGSGAYEPVGGNWPEIGDASRGVVRVVVAPSSDAPIARDARVLERPGAVSAGRPAVLRVTSRDTFGNDAAYAAARGAETYRARATTTRRRVRVSSRRALGDNPTGRTI